MELALEVWMQMSRPQGTRTGELSRIADPGGDTGWLSQNSVEVLALVVWIREIWCADLTQLPPQVQICGSELAHPKTYIICK